MIRLPVVETSPRGDYSISRNMTRRFVAEWQAAHPEIIWHYRQFYTRGNRLICR